MVSLVPRSLSSTRTLDARADVISVALRCTLMRYVAL
jgi:hypothetical protein